MHLLHSAIQRKSAFQMRSTTLGLPTTRPFAEGRCMTWVQFSHGFRLDPVAKGSPEAVVVLLRDVGDSAAEVTPVAARWATTVPTTAFIVLDGITQLDPLSCGLPPHTMLDLDACVEPTVLDRATRHLEPLLENQLRSCQLDASRLVLVGFGYGGTLALHLLLRQGWSCAGVLAFAAKLTRPLPRILRVDYKVRLIEFVGEFPDKPAVLPVYNCASPRLVGMPPTGALSCVGDRHIDHSSLRDDVALLTARGIDTRGVLLAGSALSLEAIRHGGAYLVELVATAQRGDRLHIDRESSDAQ
jgi:predicted esterase